MKKSHILPWVFVGLVSAIAIITASLDLRLEDMPTWFYWIAIPVVTGGIWAIGRYMDDFIRWLDE